MPKAIIKRAVRGVESVVEVDGVRVGTTRRHSAALGSAAWWTFIIDPEYRSDHQIKSGFRTQNHPTADRIREAAIVAFKRKTALAEGG